MPDLAGAAKRIIDSNAYMTLATADAEGRPWASPVWFAHEDYAHFLWVSKPEALHSRNLSARPEVGIVIFDSRAGVGAAEAVYVEAEAEQVAQDADERCIEIFTRRSEALGWPSWSIDEVRPPAPLRVYRAHAAAHYVLGATDERIAVSLA